MRSLIFVCTGNTCRSPMAEAIFNHLAARLDLDWTADSAGLAAVTGAPMSGQAADTLSGRYGLGADAHRSRPITEELLRARELILTMTMAQAQLLRASHVEEADRIFSLAEYVQKIERAPERPEDVADPYGSSSAVYERCAEQLEALLRPLIHFLKAENQ